MSSTPSHVQTTHAWDRPADDGDDLAVRLSATFRIQSGHCRALGSAVYAELCDRIADDVEIGGVCWEVLRSRAHLPFGSAFALRFLGAVHRLALRGRAPELAAQYPSCGGAPDAGLWSAFTGAVRAHREVIDAELDDAVQTNEVGRSAALYEGLGRISTTLGLALAVHEIGASAGLNLAMPWFRYVHGDQVRGDPDGAVEISGRWRGDVAPSFRDLDVVERVGCDVSPIDAVADPTMLLGFLWPDQTERAERTRAAIETLQRHPATVERSGAADWLDRRLAVLREGAVTVVFHSIMWQYMAEEERARITATMEAAGARATSSAPVAWLRFEPSDDHTEALTTMRLWDGGAHNGDVVLVARSGFHGEWVELV